MPAQVAGAALLIGYILTVAVSVAAGSAAISSTITALEPWRVPLSLFFIALIAYGNLRGVRESGKLFAAPTYFFMINMGVLIVWGVVSYLIGDLPVLGTHEEGMVELGDELGPARRRRRRSSSPRRSPRAAPRSPASRPSRTACPPSTSPSGATPARRWSSWAPGSA